MSDDTRPDDDQPIGTDPEASRRRVLALGAVGAAAVVSIRPALAQTAGSVLNCDIPVPDPGRAGSFIDAQGKVEQSGTKGAFPGATRPFKGE